MQRVHTWRRPHVRRVVPPSGEPVTSPPLVLAAFCRPAYTVPCGWVAARVALGRPVQLVWILGWIGVAANLIGTVATWNGGPAFGPGWYPLTLLVTALPFSLLGGRIATRKSNP